MLEGLTAMKTWSFRILLAATALALCACTPSTPGAGATPTEQAANVTPQPPVASATGSPLNPLPGQQAPAITKIERVEIETDAGKLVVEVYPEAAPNAAQRFLELVEVGFFNGTPISRVVKSPEPFVAQFGINPQMIDWKENNFKDDPTFFALERGTLCFAKAGPDTNSTQVFINLRENNHLAHPSMNFTVFAKVVDGMEAVDSFKSVGTPDMGLDQERLWTDPGYLDGLSDKPTMIKSMKKISG